MAFVDEINIHLKAGKGGNGVERWRHEKFREFGGPSGGNGGKGGDIVLLGVRDMNILSKYRHLKELSAPEGEGGFKDSKHGKNGDDLVIEIPIPSRITTATGYQVLIEHEGERKVLLIGGSGGLGNEHFKSSTNTTPHEHTDGKEGDEADVTIELELVADIGLVGLPSAGKSSLLNTLTRAQSKVGAYDFTTLEPHLGDMYGIIVADIPGLIEGASHGKGLGFKFLRHIRRTRMLAHLISVENADVIEAYTTIKKELETFDPELVKKPEIVLLSKIDEVEPSVVEEKITQFKKQGIEALPISILDDQSMKNLQAVFTERVRAM
jgi:GTP-binding protein